MPGFPSRSDAPLTNPEEEKNAASQVERRVRIKNRRKRYLDLHPEYFKEPHLELADPLLYDRLVRRFQSAEERQREGRERGYSGVLEANLLRSEARLEALAHPDPNSPLVYSRAGDGSIVALEQDVDDRPKTQGEGWDKWVEVVSLRFLRGDDVDFDYSTVDDSEEYDDGEEEGRINLETYLDQEEEEYLGEGNPTGQTGIQDF